jgi:hypothetical protein
MVIPLTSEKSSIAFIEQNGKILRVLYDAEGNLKAFFLVNDKEQDKPHDAKFVVTDFGHGCADFTGPRGGSGYYSLGTEKPGIVSIKFGTTFEMTESALKEMTFQEWSDMCAEMMLGLREGIK